MATSKCDCTHLNVHPRQIVHLVTRPIAPDNVGMHPFFYDETNNEFSVPKGWSFLVTDIFVWASPLRGPIPDPNRFILAVVNFDNGGSRIFEAAVLTDTIAHFPLTAAYVVTGGNAPTFRNTTSSTSHAKARLLGYVVKEEGLQTGESPF